LSAAPVVAGELEIRPDQFQAFIAGRSLNLTRREFELLQALADATGKVIEREEIYQRVWGYSMAHGDRSVDVFIRKLRAKLQKASPGWTYVHTHFGVGYRFQAEPADSALAERADFAGGPSQPKDVPTSRNPSDGSHPFHKIYAPR
jgi:DNA-binding response OmpR family regulator